MKKKTKTLFAPILQLCLDVKAEVLKRLTQLSAGIYFEESAFSFAPLVHELKCLEIVLPESKLILKYLNCKNTIWISCALHLENIVLNFALDRQTLRHRYILTDIYSLTFHLIQPQGHREYLDPWRKPQMTAVIWLQK